MGEVKERGKGKGVEMGEGEKGKWERGSVKRERGEGKEEG